MKILRVFRDAIAVITVAAVIFGAGYFVGKQSIEPEGVIANRVNKKSFDLKLPGEVEKQVVTVEEVEAKLMEMAELTTYCYEYTDVANANKPRYLFNNTKIKVPGATNSIEITASGVVKVGYDMDEIVVEVDDDKISITLPKAKLNDNYIIWDTVSYLESNNILNPIKFSQYEELVDKIEKKGLERAEAEGIYQKAEENVEQIMDGFLAEFKDYEIEYKYK